MCDITCISRYHLALRVLEILSRLRDAGHFSYQGEVCRFQYSLNGGAKHS